MRASATEPVEPVAAPPRAGAVSAPFWAGVIVTLYLLSMVGGYVLLRSPMATVRGNELSVDRAVFTTLNAATLTGFRQSIGVAQLAGAGQAVVVALIVIGALTALVVGGCAVARIVGARYSFARIVSMAVLLICGAILLGSVTGMLEYGADQGAVLGLSAMSNSGITLSRVPLAQHWMVHAMLLPLAIVGGLGVVVVLELVDLLRHHRPLSRYTHTVLGMSAGVYLLGVVAITLLSWSGSSHDVLVGGHTGAIDSRSLGMGFGLNFSSTRSAEWIVLLLMLVGAASGGSAGGIKLNTVAVLWCGGRDALRGAIVTRIFGIAMVWVMLYMTLIFAGLLLMLRFEPAMPADRLLFLVISAAGCVGLSQDPISATGPALFVLSGVMLMGRLLPFGILWWAATTARDNEMPIG